MKWDSVVSPTWANASHAAINMRVKFAHLKEEVPFTADPNDCEEHGRDLYARAVAGEFGEVAEYVLPPPPTEEEMAAEVRAERDRRLAETDWTQAADVPQPTKDKWAPYRQALRDVPAQEGFPFNVIWPDKPM